MNFTYFKSMDCDENLQDDNNVYPDSRDRLREANVGHEGKPTTNRD